MHQNCHLTRDFAFSLRNCTFGAFLTSELMITCQIAILTRFKWFELRMSTFGTDSKIDYICEANQASASELLQTLFCTKNQDPS